MFVAASTDCFPQLSLADALQRLVDLEFTRVEISLREGSPQLTPAQVHGNLEHAILACRDTHRLTPIAYTFDMPTESPDFMPHFASCCKLAKSTKVAVITISASELGTPYNAEIERLRDMVKLATLEGVRLGLKTEAGRMTQDPDTAADLCDKVKGLCITLDPSHYIFNSNLGSRYEVLLKYTCHTQLRDTSSKQFQVRVGQGLVEYGRLMSQLTKFDYQRAWCVNIVDQEDPQIDHYAEMRKLRLLLESLL